MTPSNLFKDESKENLFVDTNGKTEIEPGSLLHIIAMHDKRKADETVHVVLGEYLVIYKLMHNQGQNDELLVMVSRAGVEAPYETSITAEIRKDEINLVESSWVKASEQTDLPEAIFEKVQMVGNPLNYDHRGMIGSVDEHIIAYRLEAKDFEVKPKGGRILEWKPVAEVIKMLRANQFTANSALALIHLLVEYGMIQNEPHLETIKKRLSSELRFMENGYTARRLLNELDAPFYFSM